ncbi:hypothetical protein OUZ56_001247 [Daphnia magna]|uniref:Uncharacterized protein n=1 Tax=Daphnia magna TaxID=35525 RepID=A0ABR0A229_9CRUS|nr:hypothetical protein OUZ56_001247 [Daphnia magna]
MFLKEEVSVMRDHLQTVLSITSAIWHDGAAETTHLSCAREEESDLCVDNRSESRPGDSDLLSPLLIAMLYTLLLLRIDRAPLERQYASIACFKLGRAAKDVME